MKRLMLVIVESLIFMLCSCSLGTKGEFAMFIKFDKTSYDLGTSVPVEITYDNQTTGVIVIPDPSKSLDVLMHAVDVKTNEDMNYTIGKVVVTDIDRASGQYALSEPPKEQIEIMPNSSFVFTSDLNERLYLHPGGFDCFLSDNDKESNHIPITIEFTKKSVDYLFKLVQDVEQIYGRREWAMEWLQTLYPDFKLNLSLEDNHIDVKRQKETSNTIIYDQFAEWWNKNRDVKYIEELLK